MTLSGRTLLQLLRLGHMIITAIAHVSGS